MFVFEKAPFPTCHTPTLVEVESGKLLAAWVGGKAEGARDVAVWASSHDGKHWSDLRQIADEPGQPCYHPVLFRTAKDLVLNYKAGPGPQGWCAFQKRSSDGGNNWSTPVALPIGVFGPVKNKPILLADGALLAGTSFETYRGCCAWVDRSTDEGRTWKRFGPIDFPDKPNRLLEPTLLEIEPKRVLALCRSRGLGFVALAESPDSGRTWGPARLLDTRPNDLPNPDSSLDAVRTTSGDCFIVANPTMGGRFPLTLFRTADEGKTWKSVATIESEIGEFSAPAILQVSDGLLHVVYCWNRTHIKYVTHDPAKLRG